jgi:hypothetical protein
MQLGTDTGDQGIRNTALIKFVFEGHVLSNNDLVKLVS